MKLKPILYYVSIFIMIMGGVQFFLSFIDAKKIMMLKSKGIEEQGVIIDKFIQERFQGPQSGYRIHFFDDSLNLFYSNRFFKSYNDNYNRGDTLCVLHYPPNIELSTLCSFRDAYSDALFNLFISVVLVVAGWLGYKKHVEIKRYLKGN